MPGSTNATRKGNAGFTYTPSSGGSTVTYALNWPAHLVPRANLSASVARPKWRGRSLDRRTREVVTYGTSGVERIGIEIRFGEDPQDLLDMLKEAARGQTVTYTTDLSGPTSYKARIVDGEPSVREDRDTFFAGEYEAVRLTLEATSGNFDPLLTP